MSVLHEWLVSWVFRIHPFAPNQGWRDVLRFDIRAVRVPVSFFRLQDAFKLATIVEIRSEKNTVYFVFDAYAVIQIFYS